MKIDYERLFGYALLCFSALALSGCDSSSSSNNSATNIDNNNSSGQVIFSADFESDLEVAGATTVNFDGLSNFTVEGVVDLIASGNFGILCAVGNACLDLDGTEPGLHDPASILTSSAIAIEPGNYQLSLYLGGNQRRGDLPACDLADSVTIAFDSFLPETTLTFDSAETLTLREFQFTATTSGQASLRISQLGLSDSCGAILDDIELIRL